MKFFKFIGITFFREPLCVYLNMSPIGKPALYADDILIKEYISAAEALKDEQELIRLITNTFGYGDCE